LAVERAFAVERLDEADREDAAERAGAFARDGAVLAVVEERAERLRVGTLDRLAMSREYP